MVTHEDLAISFANGSKKGKASRMFIDGRAIYSYGYHFPIAFRLRVGEYLFNKDSYSASTSRHKSYVRSAVGEEEIVAEVSTSELKRAISDDSDSFVVVTKMVKPDSFNEFKSLLSDFLVGKGLSRRKANFRLKKFFVEMEKLITLNNF